VMGITLPARDGIFLAGLKDMPFFILGSLSKTSW
jgi:hypothetical protein